LPENDLPPELFAILERHRRRAEEVKVGITLPPELEKIRAYARRAIAPIKPADTSTEAEPKFLFTATRMEASRNLPPYYLVFFLLVDLLNFRDLGRFEKIAWSVPIDFEGKAYLIEHRKSGLSVFGREGQGEEEAKRIVMLLKKGVKVARPFFNWVAKEAIRASHFNIVNNAQSLFARYLYTRELYLSTREKLEAVKADIKEDGRQRQLSLWRRLKSDSNSMSSVMSFPHFRERKALSEQLSWLALGTIDAFFSWTEHTFVHLAVLQSQITTGEQLTQLIGADWNLKFKSALNVQDQENKLHLDRLITVRQQLRNFVAHGAFGKEGEAFHFHSKVGAVPVIFEFTKAKNRFSLNENLAFDDKEALQSIDAFIRHLWSGRRKPARIYIQESGLPLVLTMASDGRYAEAMRSVQAMEELVDHLLEQQDAHSNMDW